MNNNFFFKHALRWFLVASLLLGGLAMAQTEPTLNQVYATAQAGKLEQAQLMIQQVLISHPNSAKAFFVQGELYARQGNLDKAREALATAEKLAPGLPFAKPDSVQALRAQLLTKKAVTAPPGPAAHPVAPTHKAVPMAAESSSTSSSSWLLPLLLAGGVIGMGYFLFRKKVPAPLPQQAVFTNQAGLAGPQSFGAGAPAGYGMGGGGGGGGGFMQQPYGQPAGSGLGGRIMGGVATGLAVGAGVMAAQAIGRNLMGEHNPAPAAGAADNLANNNYQALDANPDMGGQNFGISDTSSWDDGGGVDVGGAGEWDN